MTSKLLRIVDMLLKRLDRGSLVGQGQDHVDLSRMMGGGEMERGMGELRV